MQSRLESCRMLRRLLSASVLLGTSLFAQWENLNPGGGGQIQGITMDPNLAGRMFLNSDVEGNYRSDDYGQSWLYIGKELIHHMAFYVEVEPGNSNRVYCGGLYGLHLSNNGGLNWTVVPALKGISTAAMAIDPSNANNLYVGNSWYVKDAPLAQQREPGESVTGARIIYYSKDRGVTWQNRTYEATTGFKQCYTVTVNPAATNTVFLGAASGLYRSTDGGNAWSKITPPTGQPSCRGADITPDGQYVYAVFSSDTELSDPEQTNVYVARVVSGTSWTWTQIASPGTPNGLYYATGVITSYWKPRVDPRSSATSHKVIIGCLRSNANNDQGLFEFTGTVSGGNVTGSWAMVFGNNANFDYDVGWNNINPQVRQYAYSPNSAGWPRRVLLASQQSLYYGDPAVPNGTFDKWLLRSSEAVDVFGPYITYATRGFQSTVNFDGTGYGNYVIQGMADNRVLESWDDGLSWTQDARPSGGQNGDYVDIIPPNGSQPAMVITAAGGGFGGINDNADASHWAKKLSNPADETDTWVSLETGASGLPTTGSRTYGSAYNPQNPQQVVLATQSGLYETTDIYARYNGTGGAFTQIYQAIFKSGNVWWDPTNSSVIYAHGAPGIIKGTKSGSTWSWQTLVSGNLDSVYYWKNGSTNYIAYASGEALYLSSNGGTSFTQVLDRTTMLNVHPEPWFGTWTNGATMTLRISGVAGYQNIVYCGSEVPDGKHGYSMYKGTINANGTVTWADWNGTFGQAGFMEIARLWDAKIVQQNNKTYYYAATRGAGLWRRQLTAADTTPPAAPTGLSATPGTGQVVLDWNNNGEADLAGYNVYRSTTSGSGYIKLNGSVLSVSNYTDNTVANGTTYYYVVRAVDTSSNESGNSSQVSATPQSTVTVTFYSVAAQDGYTTESTETSNVGGSSPAGVTGTAGIRAGDTSSDQQTKGMVSFDTSSIPDGATITSVTLRLRRGTVTGTNPFTTHGQCRVDIKGGTGFGGSTAFDNGDFEAAADATNVTQLSDAANNGDWSTGVLSATGRSFVNKTGTTQLRVYFATDDNDDAGNDYIGWYPSEGGAGNQPELVVTYQP